jgi:hypothetical protein
VFKQVARILCGKKPPNRSREQESLVLPRFVPDIDLQAASDAIRARSSAQGGSRAQIVAMLMQQTVVSIRRVIAKSNSVNSKR